MTEALNILNENENTNSSNSLKLADHHVTLGKHDLKKMSIKNFSYFGLITCLASIVLAFLFKDSLIYLLTYLEQKSTTNIVEFHLIVIILFICVSLPILWGYLVCVIICSFVYGLFYGFLIVCLYSTIGMAVSFFVCRYMFYECAHQRVQSVAYLRAISTVIESKDKGFQIIFLSRLMPIPFGLANTVFAVTDVCFRKYLLASIIGLVPSHVILCYMGSTLKSMTDVLVNENTAKTAYLVFVVQMIIAVLVMYYILKAAKHELNKHLDETSSSGNNLKIGLSGGNASGLTMLSSDSSSLSSLINGGKCPYCKCVGGSIDCEHCQLLHINIQS
jgi:protein maelstrom